MLQYKACLRVCLSTWLIGLGSSNAHAQDVILMNCDRYDGKHKFQIYVNEVEGYVLYNAQVRGSYEREREYAVVGGKEGETITIDDGLDIYINTDELIQAGDKDSTFFFAKDTATYAYAWTMPLPVKDGKLIAFGNHHSGKCSVNPFAGRK